MNLVKVCILKIEPQKLRSLTPQKSLKQTDKIEIFKKKNFARKSQVRFLSSFELGSSIFSVGNKNFPQNIVLIKTFTQTFAVTRVILQGIK